MARRKRSGRGIPRARRLAIYRRDDWTCVYCGAKFGYPSGLSLDHLTTFGRGGSDLSVNLVTACVDCNRRRDDQTLEQFVGNERAEQIRSAAFPVGY